MSKKDEIDEEKRKKKFFERHIFKLFKTISPDKGITLNAKQQLNSCLCLIIKKISQESKKYLNSIKRKTLRLNELKLSLQLLFQNNFFNELDTFAEESLKKFKEYQSNNKKTTRQEKAGIIFSPSIIEKILRQDILIITKDTPIYLASFIECLCKKILILSNEYNKKIRLTIRHMYLGIFKNDELKNAFNSFNIKFISGGVLPFIHPLLINKKRKRGKNIAIKEIKKAQKNTGLCLPKFPFEKITREQVNNPKQKIAKDAFIVLQYYIEEKILEILQKSNIIAISSKRTKITESDINLVVNFYKH